MSIKFLVLGGGGGVFLVFGGGSADFIFMGAGIFLKIAILRGRGQHRRRNRAILVHSGRVLPMCV